MAYSRRIVVAILALALVASSGAMLQPAFAHAHATLTLEDEPVAGKQIEVVLGHADEPTYGAEAGIHDGKHGLEVSLSDAATKLPLTGANLTADKYYFKDIRSFERADSTEDADSIERGVDVRGVFGESGQYLARQVQEPGIYGYRLYGMISYFGVSEVQIDTTIFCESPDGDTTKFNSPEWSGSFGCTSDITDSYFPGKSNKESRGNTDSAESETGLTTAQFGASPQPSSDSGNFNALLLGVPIAALAGVLGWRSMKKRDNGQ